jgi:hypothetical protein
VTVGIKVLVIFEPIWRFSLPSGRPDRSVSNSWIQ